MESLLRDINRTSGQTIRLDTSELHDPMIGGGGGAGKFTDQDDNLMASKLNLYD